MIDEIQVKRYCREDISLIENYEEAVNSSEPYVCHHRYELNDGIVLSVNDLKDMGLYYKRPASELIFMKRLDHKRIHTIGMVHPMYGKRGENSHWYGRKHSEETINKMREAHKGQYQPKGKYNKQSIKVAQLTLNKHLVKIWNCMRDAQREIGADHSRISECCRGLKKDYKGFIWMFLDDYYEYCAKRAISQS